MHSPNPSRRDGHIRPSRLLLWALLAVPVPGSATQARFVCFRDADLELCWLDADLDTFGDALGATVMSVDLSCSEPGESSVANDCDDANSAVNPAAIEVCDTFDNDCDTFDADCDGVVDEEGVCDPPPVPSLTGRGHLLMAGLLVAIASVCLLERRVRDT